MPLPAMRRVMWRLLLGVAVAAAPTVALAQAPPDPSPPPAEAQAPPPPPVDTVPKLPDLPGPAPDAAAPPAATLVAPAQPPPVAAPPAAAPPSPTPGQAAVGGPVDKGRPPGGAPPGGAGVPWHELVEVHGFGVLWVDPLHDPATPAWVERPGVDTFSMRFARLMVQARPSPSIAVQATIGLDNPNPLFNYELTWRGLPFVNVTVGQMRIPFGGQIQITPGYNLVMWDRPRFNYVMAKEAFRDIGVMVHSPRGEGVLDGVLEYSFGMYNGSGRARANMPVLERELGEYLFAGRVVFNAAPLLQMPPKSRLALGASYAHVIDTPSSADPALSMQESAHFLGTNLTPFNTKRDTHLMGTDLAFSAYNFWTQAELMYLTSKSVDVPIPAYQNALGASLEVAYTIAPIRLQPNARAEWFDPDLDNGDRRAVILSLGANFSIVPDAKIGLFYSHDRYSVAGTEPNENRVRGTFAARF